MQEAAAVLQYDNFEKLQNVSQLQHQTRDALKKLNSLKFVQFLF